MSKPRWRPRVTVAAVIEQDGRYLLVEENTADGLRLNTPAGHLEPGESPQDGAVREALEETARVFTPSALLGVYLAASPDAQGQPTTWLRITYCGTAGEPQPGRALDAGIVRTLWLTPEGLRASQARHRSPLVLRCVEDHLRGQRFGLDAVQAHASALGLK
ncbi:MAG: NUDIX hydrolase [Burkholderiales bacterium]|uniref:NUDIX hydrolase n=1 Tax=Ottowia sp. TaxID=1898956 RepID=UPI001ACE119B|nr:NUDIX hydrolase [Ottowia sp.]MBN9406744.1 NUDIX hydrolase [Burkholderiales bacterium]MBS0413805.1 NUDIX hydrolase [Pseudomonadota bacterium]